MHEAHFHADESSAIRMAANLRGSLAADDPRVSLSIATVARLLGVSTLHIATILSLLRHHRLIVKHMDGWARAKHDLRDHAARIAGLQASLLLEQNGVVPNAKCGHGGKPNLPP